MSEVVLQPSSSMIDSYLRQVEPLLHTYWNALHDITCKELILYRHAEVVYIPVQIHVSVPFIVSPKKQHHRRLGGEVKTDMEALYLTDLVKLYNDKLRNVVLKELLAEKELQKKESPLPRKVKKLTELKNSVEEFSRIVDRISAVYTARSMDFSCTSLPSLVDVKQVKDKLCRIRRTLKFHYLRSLFEKYDDEFKTNDESVLCAILGLGEDYGKWLFEMDIEMRKHVDKYYIERAIEEAENKAGDWIQGELYGADCLVKQLQDLGFNEETAVIISLNIPNDIIDLQKPSFWALRYLDSVFTYGPLLCNCSRYPNNENTVDVWFGIPLPSKNSGEPNDLTNVRMINISSSKSEGNTLVQQFLEEGQRDTQRRFLYHTTDHESAMSILREGININEGKVDNDFSNGDGFYLSETFENASQYRSNCYETQAIIVYTLANNLLDASKQNGWDLTVSPDSDFERVINYHIISNTKKDKRTKKDLQGVTFIRGPMCKDRNKTRGVSRVFPLKNKIQFCIRDEIYAGKFGSLENVACVIFY